MRLPLLLTCFLPLLCFSQQLQCYHCINRLTTADITKDERNALKTALFARFNIPPSSEYCADGGNDVLFRTVQKEVCPVINDTCIRIVSEGELYCPDETFCAKITVAGLDTTNFLLNVKGCAPVKSTVVSNVPFCGIFVFCSFSTTLPLLFRN